MHTRPTVSRCACADSTPEVAAAAAAAAAEVAAAAAEAKSGPGVPPARGVVPPSPPPRTEAGVATGVAGPLVAAGTGRGSDRAGVAGVPPGSGGSRSARGISM